MSAPDYDYVIIGQGLAGTLLAWRLHQRGRRVLVFDRDETVTASRIAAGLVNPISGQRICLSWRLAEFLPVAEHFYRFAEEAMGGRTFFHRLPMVRLLPDDIALQRWSAIADNPEVRRYLSDPQPDPLVNAAQVHSGAGGFEIASAHILDVPGFLEASRNVLDVRKADIDVANTIDAGENAVSVRLGPDTLIASRLVFCQGPDGRHGNPFFDWVPFRCAKGEILTVKCPDLRDENRILNGSGWLAPIPGDAPGFFRAGSTYVHDDLTNMPTEAGRAAIEAKLRGLLKAEFCVTGHTAAVRPIISRSRALIGLHPKFKRIGFFNGLGSKGSLNGPAIAEKFAAHLEEGTPLEEPFDLLKNL